MIYAFICWPQRKSPYINVHLNFQWSLRTFLQYYIGMCKNKTKRNPIMGFFNEDNQDEENGEQFLMLYKTLSAQLVFTVSW